MRVVVTGGGSGGHIYPAIAVAEAIAKANGSAEVRYVGSRDGMEARIVPSAGIAYHGVSARRLRKIASLSTVATAGSLAKGCLEASRFLRSFRPGVVISTGGYVAAAAAIAAARNRIPLVVLAPDAAPGRTNLWLARFAARICIMFAATAARFPADRVVLTGLPIRAGIVSGRSQAEARQAMGLNPDMPVVLATGGSQGAARLNRLVVDSLSHLEPQIQVLHQVGESNASTVGGALAARAGYRSVPYLDAAAMPLAYRAADITLCRSGVGSLAEATANGLPMLMVPLPTAYADHQTLNAQAMEAAGAGILLRQPDLTPEDLARAISDLLADGPRRESIAAASRAAGRPDAAERVAEIALGLAA